MIINPYAAQGSFGYVTSNVLTSRPNVSYGTIVAVGTTANTKGSWVQLIAGASIAYDCYKLVIKLHNVSSSGVARNILADIGIDTSGGSSYTPLIENLCASMVTTANVLRGASVYSFPLFIPAGSSLAVRGQTSDTTNATGYCGIIVYGRPSKPDKIVYGHAVETLGANTSNSQGVAVTANSTASFGSYTSIGTTTKNWKNIQIGWGINNTTITALSYRVDIAAGSNDQRLLMDNVGNGTTTEQLSFLQDPNSYYNIPSGTALKAHIWCSGTAVTGQYITLYGVY